jgi:hypothetical protein
MVGELLAGCPEDDIIAGAVKVAEQRKAEKDGDERKRQPSDDYERKIGEVSLTSVYANTGAASHDGYSTFGSASIPKFSRSPESALEPLSQETAKAGLLVRR